MEEFIKNNKIGIALICLICSVGRPGLAVYDYDCPKTPSSPGAIPKSSHHANSVIAGDEAILLSISHLLAL